MRAARGDPRRGEKIVVAVDLILGSASEVAFYSSLLALLLLIFVTLPSMHLTNNLPPILLYKIFCFPLHNSNNYSLSITVLGEHVKNDQNDKFTPPPPIPSTRNSRQSTIYLFTHTNLKKARPIMHTIVPVMSFIPLLLPDPYCTALSH